MLQNPERGPQGADVLLHEGSAGAGPSSERLQVGTNVAWSAGHLQNAVYAFFVHEALRSRVLE
jgi:hypothetical protein